MTISLTKIRKVSKFKRSRIKSSFNTSLSFPLLLCLDSPSVNYEETTEEEKDEEQNFEEEEEEDGKLFILLAILIYFVDKFWTKFLNKTPYPCF